MKESKIIAQISNSGDGYLISIYEEEIGNAELLYAVVVDAINLNINIKLGKDISWLIKEKLANSKC